MKKMIKWLKNLFWWRFYYIKTRLTTQEAHQGRCLLCQAGDRSNPTYKTYPKCYDYGCPCKWNERLIIRG